VWQKMNLNCAFSQVEVSPLKQPAMVFALCQQLVLLKTKSEAHLTVAQQGLYNQHEIAILVHASFKIWVVWNTLSLVCASLMVVQLPGKFAVETIFQTTVHNILVIVQKVAVWTLRSVLALTILNARMEISV